MKGAATGEARSPKYLRITVTRTGSWPGDDGEQGRRGWMWPGHMGGRSREVTIRVPVALVRNGMRLGGHDSRPRREMNIDITSERGGKAQIRITSE